MTNPTDERDAYEHILRQMPRFAESWLKKLGDDYLFERTEFGWQVYQKTLLMMIERANHA